MEDATRKNLLSLAAFGRHETAARAPVICTFRIAVILLLASISSVLVASPPANESLPGGVMSKLQRRGDLTLRQTSLSEAMFTISDLWGLNLVVGEEVKGSVTGVFKDASLADILDSILLSNGYGYRAVGQSLVIMPLEELGDIHPLFKTETIPLQNIRPGDVMQSARLFSSPKGKVEGIESANSLLVVDFPDRVLQIREFVQRIDQATAGRGKILPEQKLSLEVTYIAPQHVPAKSLQETITAILSEDGSFAILERENRIMVVDYPENLRLVKQAATILDKPRMQVRITALIYDLDLQDRELIGVNWGQSLKFRGAETQINSASALHGGAIAAAGAGAATGGTASAIDGVMQIFNTSRHFDLNMVAQLLQTSRDSRLLADPTVVVRDNERATISIVREIPYQQLTQTQQGGNIGTTAFKEAGIKMHVTPRISSDGTITMDVTPSFSVLVGYTEGPEQQPIIDRREAQTSLRVANRETVVIGGLRQREELANVNAIPGLRHIKKLGIGKLFTAKDTDFRESELIVFVRPEIVGYIEAGKPREMQAERFSKEYIGSITTAGQPHQSFGETSLITRPVPLVMDEDYMGPPPGAVPMQPAPQFAPEGEELPPPVGEPRIQAMPRGQQVPQQQGFFVPPPPPSGPVIIEPENPTFRQVRPDPESIREQGGPGPGVSVPGVPAGPTSLDPFGPLLNSGADRATDLTPLSKAAPPREQDVLIRRLPGDSPEQRGYVPTARLPSVIHDAAPRRASRPAPSLR